MSTALFTHPSGLEHVTPPGHPERVDRLVAIAAALKEIPLDRRSAPAATSEDLQLCHPATYVARIEAAVPAAGTRALDGDTYLAPGSFRAALHAAGGTIAAVDAVLDGAASNAFVAVRPPGHHAEAETPMGFCLFNSIAVATKHALDRRGLSRIAVVDFDVHHGNGTQALLWDEPRAFFASSHQMPLWPGSGRREERGAHGTILNLPLPPGSDGALMRSAWEQQVFPALDSQRPELILVSAGFDAHRADPLAALDWEVEDFAWLTDRLCDLAETHCDGRIVSTLEGGYDLQALAAGTAAHVETLRRRGA